MHCNANSVRMSSCIGDNKLKDKCWMNLLIVFVYFVDFKGSLCFWKAGNYLTFKGPILHLAKAVALVCAFLPVPEHKQPGPWALGQGRLLISENQLFLMCRAIEVLHYKGTEMMFSQDRLRPWRVAKTVIGTCSSTEQGHCSGGTWALLMLSCLHLPSEDASKNKRFNKRFNNFVGFSRVAALQLRTSVSEWLKLVLQSPIIWITNFKQVSCDGVKSYQQLLLTLLWSCAYP